MTVKEIARNQWLVQVKHPRQTLNFKKLLFGTDMMEQERISTVKPLLTGDKNILTLDKSNTAGNKRLAKLGIPQTEKAWGAYCKMLVRPCGYTVITRQLWRDNEH